MNRWLLSIGVLLVLLLSGIYFLIPGELTVSKVSFFAANPGGAFRAIGRVLAPGIDTLRSGGDVYRGTGRTYPLVAVTIGHGGQEIPSGITVIPLANPDSVVVEWQCKLEAGGNPIRRVLQYREAYRIKENMAGVLSSLRPLLEDPRQVYGVSITEGSTRDSLLIMSRDTVRKYPGTAEIYTRIRALQQYAAAGGAGQMDPPMLHVDALGGGLFQVMIALPVDKPLPGRGDLIFKRLVRGSFLQTEVRGGPGTIKDAHTQIQNYIADYHMTTVAIPFEILVTDRSQVSDTLQWVTRVYQPVN
jgi:hypothetical protein